MRLPLIATITVVLGCGPNEQVSTKATPRLESRNPARGVAKVGEVQGFYAPESVRYDAEQDLFFVSNVLGYGSVKDGAGYIARVNARAYGDVDVFIESGIGGAELHAPKGMAIQGDTLWVTDIDVLRGFHKRTGGVVATVPFAGAVMLNDVAVGPDGALYVTDTGIIMSPDGVIYAGGEKIFRMAGRAVAPVAAGKALKWPNGITWDSASRRWIVVSFDQFASEVYALDSTASRKTLLARGKGKFDGVELLPDGATLVTSWSDSSLHRFHGSTDTVLIPHIASPADLGFDTRRNRVAIPLLNGDKVLFYRLAADTP